MKRPKIISRLLTFDLLRGYFLLAIILNHLFWYPNGFEWVAARGELFVTAAEGFFLISGIILGIVRGRKLVDKPYREAALLLLKRGVQLYAASIILMILFTLLGWIFFYDNPGLKPGIRPIDEPFIAVLFGALSFEYIYGWADYLRLYAIFILMSPLALWLLRKGKWYILIAASIGLWLLFPATGTSLKTDELLMPIAWQLIFFIGFTIGFYWNSLSEKWQNLPTITRKRINGVVLSLAITTLVANILLIFGKDLGGNIGQFMSSIITALSPYFHKESLPLTRLFLFGLWFWLGFWLFSRYEKFIVKWFGWILINFGQNSLYVYIIHAFIIFFAHLIMLQASSNFLINFFGTIAVVAIILLAVKTKFLMKIIPR